ncbi:MAG: PadR family transcriptional regulator [Candidatus Woesearchaeota archaeon]|nr:PadR family transcriptional regulator [Candidatus Woesearchaeota archaeon]
MKDSGCSTKGFLSLLILWMVKKEAKTGAQLATELEARKGTKPSPGTIYPALKDLVEKGLLKVNTNKAYSLTSKGKQELESGLQTFCTLFSDFNEMKGSCCK